MIICLHNYLNNFVSDILVYVGKALFLRPRHDREVVAELAQKNVKISTREIAYWGKKEAMQLRGGI